MRHVACLSIVLVSLAMASPVHAEYFLGDASGLTWAEAAAGCESEGGHLATITTDSEQAAVLAFMGSSWGRTWIGLHQSSGTWQWVTGESLSYENWAPGQPGGQGPVVFMFGTSEFDPPFDAGTWNDTDDIVEPTVESYLCEIDGDDDDDDSGDDDSGDDDGGDDDSDDDSGDDGGDDDGDDDDENPTVVESDDDDGCGC